LRPVDRALGRGLSLLSRVESVFESVAEGGFRRLFSPRLQPLEVARALEKEMANGKMVGTASLDVPNRFVARLNPADYERFAAFRGSVERDVAAYLDRRADEEGFRPLGRIRVELASDASVPRSLIRAEASFEAAAEGPPSAALERTSRFEPVAATRATRTLVLTAEDGQELRVGQQPVRIGRGVDNDLVVRDVRVSRQHAAIEPSGDGWIVRDMSSTNGTYLGGQRVDEARVNAATELSLGGYRIKLRPG
jgi:Protein of unknown function (DUF3662)/Inner membrane component of T3SS, cytoplasmic domain